MNDRHRIQTGSSQDDDEFDSTLISYDEAIARGANPDAIRDLPDSEFGQRLKRSMACVQFLERLWPRAKSNTAAHFAPLSNRNCHDVAAQSVSVPVQIGRFEIVRELGHGGCGIVFLAIDPALRREVALKVPRPGAMLTQNLRGRFLREARAAAALNHPNVVSIYEAGEANQICYIAEAYCRGPTLAAWLKKRTEPVPAEWAAQIVATLADAVQHAHLNGVLHRDLKPSNVLLSFDRQQTSCSADSRFSPHRLTNAAGSHLDCDATSASIPHASGSGLDEATPLITDFGLCKMTEENLDETRSGVLVGTASYMAPEQASGNAAAIGPATDVYGLGAILYEVITGRPPFPGDRPLEILQQVERADPVPPHKLRQRVPPDIETICLKCLEKESHRRYPSAKELAEDLRRFLKDEPIRARRPTILERAAKFVRRHQSAVMTGAAAAVAALALTVGILLDRNARINAHAQAAEKQHQLAQQNLRKAREAVDRMLTAVAEEQLRFVPQMEQVRRKLLEDALEFYQQFSRQEGDDASIRRETALATGRLGCIYNMLGRRDEARAALKQAIDQLEPMAADSQLDADSHVALIEFYAQFAWTLPLPERQADVEQLCRTTLAHAERLAAEYPDAPRHQKQLAVQCVSLAHTIRQKNPDESELLCRRAIALCGSDVAYRDELALAWATLGSLLNLNRRADEAEQASRQALSICEENVGDNANQNRLAAETLFGLGRILAVRGNTSEAEQVFRRSLSIFQQLVDKFPTVPAYRNSVASVQLHLAKLMKTVGRTDEAEQLYQQAIAVNARLVTDFPSLPDYRLAHLGSSLEFGQLMFAVGRMEEAVDAFDQALGHGRKLAELSPSKLDHRRDLAITHIELGRLHAAAGRKAEADAEFRQAVVIADNLETDFGTQPDFRADLASAHSAIAAKLRFTCQYSDADRIIRLAIAKSADLAREVPGESSYVDLQCKSYYMLGFISAAAGQFAEAEQAYQKCIELGLDTCGARSNLAAVQLALGRMDQYRNTCAHLIARYGETEDWNDANSVAWFCLLSPDSGVDFTAIVRLAERAVAGRSFQVPSQRYDCINTLGVALYRSGRFQECIDRLHEAIEAHGKGGNCQDWLFLAMAHHKLGQLDESRHWYDRAIQWIAENQRRLELRKTQEAEVLRFRDEATDVLGIR